MKSQFRSKDDLFVEGEYAIPGVPDELPIRHGRLPLEPDQKPGTRAQTQSYIVGSRRALVVEYMRKLKGHVTKSQVIRELIDKEAERLGIWKPEELPAAPSRPLPRPVQKRRRKPKAPAAE